MSFLNNAINNTSKTTVFMTSGTWTRDIRTTFVQVLLWDAGCGGGSGRQGLTTTAQGGNGGTGQGCMLFFAPANYFSSTETVTIGSGGAGGAAQTSADTDGNAGSAGGFSFLGSLESNVGSTAGGGAGGLTNPALNNPGLGGACGVWFSTQGTATAGSGDNSHPVDAGSVKTYIGAGSGGGGSTANSVTAQQAGNGSSMLSGDETFTLLAGGAGGIESGTIDGGNGLDAYPATFDGAIIGGSGGGGGGGQSMGIVAGIGGNGGFPGGGGGGGGGSLDGTDSGAGGAGADGLVIVFEQF